MGIAARIQLAPATASGRRAAGGPWALAALLVVAVLAWVATTVRMAGMDAGPGTDPGSLGFYLSTWTVMMAAMMLPSAAPAVLAYRDTASRGGQLTATAWFAAGYLVLWAASGLIGYALLEAGRSLAPGALAWDRGGRWVAAGVLVLAAAYELTPAKRACLTRCRGRRPDGPAAGRRGPASALSAGVGYGGWCLGCCWAMMAALFALGAMSLVWMALITVLVGAQKLLPWTRATMVGSALLLLVLAVGLAVAASSVPGLTVPGGGSAMHMMMSSGA